LAELAADLGSESERLELVLEIVVKSGLVLEVPATPIGRYQLVHDYLVPFIRKQRGAELLELRQKLKQTEAEKQILAEARQKAEQLSAAAKRQVKWLATIGATIFSISLIGAVTLMGVAVQQLKKVEKLAELERSASQALRMFESGNNQIDVLISAVNMGNSSKLQSTMFAPFQITRYLLPRLPSVRFSTTSEKKIGLKDIKLRYGVSVLVPTANTSLRHQGTKQPGCGMSRAS
jgi:hypothetical protein